MILLTHSAAKSSAQHITLVSMASAPDEDGLSHTCQSTSCHLCLPAEQLLCLLPDLMRPSQSFPSTAHPSHAICIDKDSTAKPACHLLCLFSALSFCCHFSMPAYPAAGSTWRLRRSRSSQSTVHFLHAMFARRMLNCQLPCQRACPPSSCCTLRLRLSRSLATAASSERRAQMRSFCLATVSDTPASGQSPIIHQCVLPSTEIVQAQDALLLLSYSL